MATDERTQALLDELRGALEDLQEGHGDQARIAELAGAVERRLRAERELRDDEGSAGGGQHDSLAEDLQEAAVRLEADHPHLAGALRRAVDVLGGMGL
jgi:hypothetical protein